MGTLVFFFGQNLSLQGSNLKNYLGLDGLQPAEVTELAFRVLRTQRFRNKIMTAKAENTDLYCFRKISSACLAFCPN